MPSGAWSLAKRCGICTHTYCLIPFSLLSPGLADASVRSCQRRRPSCGSGAKTLRSELLWAWLRSGCGSSGATDRKVRVPAPTTSSQAACRWFLIPKPLPVQQAGPGRPKARAPAQPGNPAACGVNVCPARYSHACSLAGGLSVCAQSGGLSPVPLTASLLPVHNIHKSTVFVACACELTRSCPSTAGPYHAPTAGLSRGQVARLIAEENTRRLLRVGHATLKCARPKHS